MHISSVQTTFTFFFNIKSLKVKSLSSSIFSALIGYDIDRALISPTLFKSYSTSRVNLIASDAAFVRK